MIEAAQAYGRKEGMEGKEDIHKELADFLNIQINFDALDRGVLRIKEIVEKLEREAVEKLIPDRDPFLNIEKIVVFRNEAGRECMLASAFVTEADCKGHTPECPMVPLIHLSKVMALSGRALMGYLTKDSRRVAEIDGTGNVSSGIRKMDQLPFLRPPAHVLVHAEYLGTEDVTKTFPEEEGEEIDLNTGETLPQETTKKALAFVNGTALIHRKGKLTRAGKIRPLNYLITSLAGLKRGIYRKE